MSATEFYDGLAPYYHLIYEDWESSIKRQGTALDSVIRSFPHQPLRSVLDVACGIGTQSLGLAAYGYDVTASDISAKAIERARLEAVRRSLSVAFSVADMRGAHLHHAREFDVVLCADNSLPHLLSDQEICASLGEFFLCTKPGGLCIISVRDYATLERGGAQVKPYGVRVHGETRYILFQVWTWRDSLYDVSFYIVHDVGGSDCHTVVLRSTYYAISVADLIRLMYKAGFANVQRIDNEFFQPLIVGVRPSGA
ncbi:MAG TPA: methyltransferase domain-containing protein [Casimicrobiaceae bacterium]|nr:methyltransferase domain-containing protein [Casimicrobiaceae bacterium]